MHKSFAVEEASGTLSHTNSFAFAANAQSNNNNNKKQSSVRSESVLFSTGQSVPPATAAAEKTIQSNAEQQQQREINPTSSPKNGTIPRTIPSPVLPRTECRQLPHSDILEGRLCI